MTPEIEKYMYRKEFGLTAAELEEEPVDQFFTNLTIIGLIRDKERIQAEHVSG